MVTEARAGQFPPFFICPPRIPLEATSPVTMMAPVPVVPVMMMPMAVMPVVMVPVVMVMPAHLQRLDLIDLVLRHDRRLDICRRRRARRLARDRCDRGRLRACGKHDRARDQSGTEIQEIPRFHEFMAFREVKEKILSLAAST
jgi:hypothetical protein